MVLAECIICKESAVIGINTSAYVCDKCKSAVMTMRQHIDFMNKAHEEAREKVRCVPVSSKEEE